MAYPKPLTWETDGSCIRCTSHNPDSNGYPHIRRNGMYMTIARHILFKRHGIQPSEVVSRHTCDNRWCIRPNHILIGSHADNVRDRDSRNRFVVLKRERNGSAKLSDRSIEAIRSEYLNRVVSQRSLAKKYGISQAQIWNIVNERQRI